MTITSTVDAEMTKAAEMTKTMYAGMPFAERLEITPSRPTPNRSLRQRSWQPEHCGAGGVLHGGYLMAMADSNGAMLAFLNLASCETTTTDRVQDQLLPPGHRWRIQSHFDAWSTKAAPRWRSRPTSPTNKAPSSRGPFKPRPASPPGG